MRSSPCFRPTARRAPVRRCESARPPGSPTRRGSSAAPASRLACSEVGHQPPHHTPAHFGLVECGSEFRAQPEQGGLSPGLGPLGRQQLFPCPIFLHTSLRRKSPWAACSTAARQPRQCHSIASIPIPSESRPVWVVGRPAWLTQIDVRAALCLRLYPTPAACANCRRGDGAMATLTLALPSTRLSRGSKEPLPPRRGFSLPGQNGVGPPTLYQPTQSPFDNQSRSMRILSQMADEKRNDGQSLFDELIAVLLGLPWTEALGNRIRL